MTNFNSLRFKSGKRVVDRAYEVGKKITYYHRMIKDGLLETENEEYAKGWNAAITAINLLEK
jgi:hypothetical protein